MKMKSSPGEQKRKRTLAEKLGLNGGVLCSLAILAAPANGCEPTNDWCGVKPVVQNKCGTCHGVQPGIPSFATYANTQAASTLVPSQKVWQRMQARVNAGQMPPLGAPNGPLTDAERTQLTNWFNAGAPAGACATQ